MKRTVRIDPFFYDQPDKSFVGDLMTPVHREKPEGFVERRARDGEVDASGLYLAEMFPGDAGLLDTSYADFGRFAEICGIAGRRYPIRLRLGETPCFEAWRADISEGGTVVTAADTEGVRRALICLEGEMLRRGGAILPRGIIEKKPHMRVRITRCFFSPINRPPKYGDELSDDTDYYPEEYLNRLMHDGANAVWIYTRFSDLVPSSFVPEYGRGGEARLEKLRRVTEKCARYGIRPYVFAIEPVALPEEQMRLIGADGGSAYNGNRLFCVNHPQGRAFVEELGRELFQRCPGLGGFISITYGERPTSCSSAYGRIDKIGLNNPILCPRCRDLPPGQVLANAAAALASGIHKSNPQADVISWTYGHRLWPLEDVRQYVRRAPKDVILMQNFEEMGYAKQLGRTRQGVDYWLSYAGPSALFSATAQEAQKERKPLFMKTQVCCSHELATVPYVPVPGILFDKYRAARDCGVEGVMQCWYFGNYPSMMSRAAGELSFWRDFSDKRAFLVYLAGIYWGAENAPIIADAWEEFEKGYVNYPLNIMFSYYGPMHDGPVWELALLPKNFSLPRSWQTLDPTDGDRIGECLMSGHTLDEAIVLCGRMADHWRRGLERMKQARPLNGECREQLRVAEAVDILFHSGLSILSFYRLRDRLGRREGDAAETLREMRRIVLEEIDRSLALRALCEKDGRLGYHSEGEGYKYFPKKLDHRVARLKELLENEFPQVSERIARSLPPLSYYCGEEDGSRAYHMKRGPVEEADWERIDSQAAFRAAYGDKTLTMEFRMTHCVRIDPEFRLAWPAPGVELTADGETRVSSTTYLYYSVFGRRVDDLKALWTAEKREEDGTLRVTLDRAAIDWEKDLPFKMRLDVDGKLWCAEEDPIRTLGKPNVSPGEYDWMMPEGFGKN